MTFIDGKTGLTRNQEITKTVSDFFDEEGTLCYDLYEPEVRMLQGKIAAETKKD